MLNRPDKDALRAMLESQVQEKQVDVDSASTYAEVGQELEAFIARYPNAAWASWGDYDARQLERDAGFAACPSLLSGQQHFNVRKWHKGSTLISRRD